MGKLTKKDIKHVAKLSNLKLSLNEISAFEKELSSVISYIENLNEVDISGVEPTSQTTGLINVLREDEIRGDDMLSVDEVISGTNKTHNNLFKVPMVLREKKEK